MTGQDLIREMAHYRKKLDTATGMLATNGRKYAEAEHDYRIALAKAILEERASGIPVTIIGDVCRGKRDIAKLKLERDIAETLHQANLEAINSYKTHIRVIEAQIAREWGVAK